MKGKEPNIKELRERIDRDRLPRHVAIIMDGNGRWAKERGLMRVKGHMVGVESVRNIVRAAGDLGVKVLTLYAFSTENWNRPRFEVKALMGLLQRFLEKELVELSANNVRLRAIGQTDKLPDGPRRTLARVIEATAHNSGLVLNLALSYGARAEITRAAANLARLCQEGSLRPEEITEDLLAGQLYTAGLPEPDLLIRTGGEYRLSNFLLWQASYAEIYVTETKWPDFRRAQLIAAIHDYQQRQRRFGKTGEQVCTPQTAAPGASSCWRPAAS